MEELQIAEPQVPRLNISSARRPNPFVIRMQDLDFNSSAIELENSKNERLKYLQMPIVERTKLLTPRISMREITPPPIRLSRPESSRKFDKKSYRRSKRVAEKVTETRDVFLMELILNKKEKQKNYISKTIEDGQENVKQLEEKITEESQFCTRESDRIEMELQKARRQAEFATTNRVELEKETRKKVNLQGIMCSKITKNVEILELYRSYDEFLSSVCPDDKTKEDFFKEPDALINIIQNIEKDNMFVLQQCDILEELESRGNKTLSEMIKYASSTLDYLESTIAKQAVPEMVSTQLLEDNKKLTSVESELEELSGIVTDLFMSCYGKKAILTPVEMLGKIEETLESYYKESTVVKTSFMFEKQNIIDLMRKEEARKLVIFERERNLQEKKEKALARATKPIKKRCGRKLMERCFPNIHQQKTEEQLLLQQKEKARVHELLYGDD